MAAKDRPQNLHPTQFPRDEAVSFDVDAFDEAIRSQGVTFIHYKAMRCPVGMTNQYDTERAHDDHAGCSNGFIYMPAGKVTCLFTGNSASTQPMEMGYANGATVQVTLPRFYDGTQEPIYIAKFDRLYLDEESIAVVNWHLFTAHMSGRDKLQFPAIKVTDLIDADNEKYTQGVDFDLVQGQVVWTGQHRPGLDLETGRGKVCAIRYLYRPYWYVKQLIHEVRVTQAENPVTGERLVQRMPQAIVIEREYVFEKEDKDEQAPDPESPRQVKGPADGIWGPR